MKKLILVILAIAVLCTPFLATSNAAVFNDKNILITHSYSTNWSGYAIETSLAAPQTGVVTDVKGSWTVPAIVGNAKSTYSSFWVGIDGYSSSSVEQIGTDSDTNQRGQVVYYAWYEMYPAFPVNLNSASYPVRPGDQITGEVSYKGGSFTLSLSDATRSWTFSITIQNSGLQRSIFFSLH